MNAAAAEFRSVDRALLLAVASGLIADSYLPFALIPLRQAVEHAGSAAEFAHELTTKGITHIASHDDLLGRFMRDNLDASDHERWTEFRHRHLIPLYRHGPVGLYEMI